MNRTLLCKSPIYPKFINFVFWSTLLVISNVSAQTGSIKGKITDATAGEELIGANILIQGTSKGTTTDVNGNYSLDGLEKGSYNLVISYVSYEQLIMRAEVKKGESVTLDIKLQPSAISVGEVKVTANKRTDTEMAIISSLRSGNQVVSGISKQQISRSQDKDASEVIARVPGVTVRDGKFINVRGLDERYNVVWLNGISTPSSESDRRAFSFDVLPSSLIDNIVLYKTPAPEIPADFAGAVVQIQTKNTVDANSVELSYAAGYRQYTTFDKFYTYQGGKTDWLGFDDGTRNLPAGFPSAKEFKNMSGQPTDADRQKITELGRAFSKTWYPHAEKAIPDQSFQLNVFHKFLLGKVSLGNVTSVGYSVGNQYRNIFRAGYEEYDVAEDHPDTSYYFHDDNYSTKTKLNGLFNWLLVFGNNQKIEFRNFFNQISDKTSLLRDGRDFGSSFKRGTELGFQSRSIYSGQLSSDLSFNEGRTSINWTLGYAYTNKLMPDIRRIEQGMNADDGPNAPYTTSITFDADPKLLGRLTLNMYEHVYSGGLNLIQKFAMGNLKPEIKTGLLIEKKDRSFSARNIGFAFGNVSQFNWNLPNVPIDTLFLDKNINFTDGIKVAESTNLQDSYDANNTLYAGYIGINIPVNKFKVYGGLRVEKNRQVLNSFHDNGSPWVIDNDLFDLFPSVNMSFDITSKSLIRFAYGRTINRPEFREIAPFVFYNFEEKATYYGNPDLVNSYINNYDIRYEIFPAAGDMITLGGFYKHFKTPIEAHLVNAGSGLNYKYSNAESAQSLGVELDIRKSLRSLENSNNFPRLFKDFVLVFNGSLIHSQLKTNDKDERDSTRAMQGQAPYIINTGLYYDNSKIGLMISAMYNVIGERMAFVGDKNNPHMYQIPRNLLDLTVNKKIGKHFVLKGGIKDIFNQPYELRQNEIVQLLPNDPEHKERRVQKTQVYKPSRAFTIGFTLIL
jgi:outer membrane receptor for ferrienterochelin and colicin